MNIYLRTQLLRRRLDIEITRRRLEVMLGSSPEARGTTQPQMEEILNHLKDAEDLLSALSNS